MQVYQTQWLAIPQCNRMLRFLGNLLADLVCVYVCLCLHVCAGESWGHLCTVRVVLYWNHAQRFATLYKSPMRPEAVVPFQITVRDI